MPVTITYDLRTDDGNHRNYLRSMLERYGWERIGGTVLRYNGRPVGNRFYDDWLNDIAPSIMFFRSYIQEHNIALKFLTIDCVSTSFLDHSDPLTPLGNAPEPSATINLRQPTNRQSSEATVKDFIDACAHATQ